jgi:hypothetical protein
MGNSSSSPTAFATDTVYNTKADLILAANDHNHALGKACRVYRNQKNVLHIVCIHQYQNMWKTDKLNAKNKKEYVANGGDPQYFQKEEYQSICNGSIKAHPVKKNKLSLHKCSDIVRITSSSPHTCSLPTTTTKGSRSVPHAYKVLAKLASNTVHKNPHAQTKMIGNIVEEKINVAANSLPYYSHYNIKRACDIERWGNKTHQYGTVVHILECMKEFDPDSRIFSESISG